MKDFNLSDWALGHRSLVWFLMLVCLVAGVMAYSRLGREEDPPFAIKTMVVQASWPGATIKDTCAGPVPEAAPTVIQAALLDALHGQPAPVAIDAVPVPPVGPTSCDGGVTV